MAKFMESDTNINTTDENKKHDDLLLKYMEDNNIPYNSGECFKHVGTSLDYVIPGAVIKIKVGKFGNELSQSTEKCIDQMERLRFIIPDNIKIYLYLPNAENTSYFNNDKWIIINDVKDIVIEPFVYYAVKPYHIKTLVSDLNTNYEDDLKKYSNKIYTEEYIYNRCLPILLDHEYDKLSRFEFKFESEESILKKHKYVCYLNKTKCPSLNSCVGDILELTDKIPMEYFTYFRYMLTGLPLSNDKRLPIRNIDGTTFVCIKCCSIYYLEYLSKNTSENMCKYCC